MNVSLWGKVEYILFFSIIYCVSCLFSPFNSLKFVLDAFALLVCYLMRFWICFRPHWLSSEMSSRYYLKVIYVVFHRLHYFFNTFERYWPYVFVAEIIPLIKILKIYYLLFQVGLLLFQVLLFYYNADALHISGVWSTDKVYTFLARFAFQKTSVAEIEGTRGYIFGNISSLDYPFSEYCLHFI